jgi:3-oxoacyl-[acyl-carrier-protein] synthase-3
MALERAGVKASEIGMLIGGGSAPELLSPAQGCAIAAGLGVTAPAFDIASACTSFFVPLHLLSMMDPARVPDFVMMVIPEVLTATTDYRNRADAVLFGDGAVAAVLSTRVPGRASILGNILASDPASFDKVSIPRHGFFRQEGQSVQKFAIKNMISMIKQLQASFQKPDRAWGFVGHQANFRMLERVCESTGVAPERHFHNVADFGNTGAVGSPSVISQRWDRWTPRDDVGVAGVGAGLTSGSYLLRFLR